MYATARSFFFVEFLPASLRTSTLSKVGAVKLSPSLSSSAFPSPYSVPASLRNHMYVYPSASHHRPPLPTEAASHPLLSLEEHRSQPFVVESSPIVSAAFACPRMGFALWGWRHLLPRYIPRGVQIHLLPAPLLPYSKRLLGIEESR